MMTVIPNEIVGHTLAKANRHPDLGLSSVYVKLPPKGKKNKLFSKTLVIYQFLAFGAVVNLRKMYLKEGADALVGGDIIMDTSSCAFGLDKVRGQS